jgi:hypothetical protein
MDNAYGQSLLKSICRNSQQIMGAAHADAEERSL